MKKNKNVLVVGAGICGLTTAYRLKKAGFEVCVLESLPYVGGRTRSVKVEDCIIDTGATVLLGTYKECLSLIAELGIEEQLETVSGSFAVPRNGSMHLIPLDRLFRGMLKTPLLSISGKLSMLKLVTKLLPLITAHSFTSLSPLKRADKETLAQYCARTMPSETYDYLLNPMLKFLYIHNGETGSLIELLWWLNALGLKPPKSFKKGMNTLSETIASELDVRLSHSVNSISPTDEGIEIQTQTSEGLATFSADFCVVSTPAPVTSTVAGEVMSPSQSEFMKGRIYDPCLVVCFCTHHRPELDVIMVEVPDEVSTDLATIVFQHNIASERAPAGKGIVNAYFTGEWSRRLFEQSDETILEAARELVLKLVPEVNEIDGFHIQRWPHNASLSEVGACEKIERFEASLDETDRVIYVGDYLVQASVNVAVALGNKAAERIIDNAKNTLPA